MIRALWTGASGMTAQQTSLDNIANNLSNVNTAGFKKQTTEFSTLLYQKLQRKVTDNNGDPKPVIGQVGLGVRVSGLSQIFTQGAMLETGRKFDFCIEGEGFFRVQLPDGTIGYTRNGALQTSMTAEGVAVCTAEGYSILDDAGQPIIFGPEYDMAKVNIDQWGNFTYPDEETNVAMNIGVKVSLAQFNNPAGLNKISGSMFRESENSGAPRLEADDPLLTASKVHSGYLEGSNVATVDEIVNLIVTQRAYEMNSKVITASDEMMQQANNLRS